MYSQNDEEAIIKGIVDTVFGDTPGNVVDIGAFDGKTNSNSLALIERGWNAVLIEPAAEPFAKLMALHRDNPRVTLVNAAIGEADRIVEMIDFPGDGGQRRATREANPGSVYRWWIAQITPATLVNQIGTGANVLTIDTEGTSFDILTLCPIKSWRPSVIVVEHDGRGVEISGWGRENGYRVCGLNAENIILGSAL
jgi:FkbM family methyltransferase